MSEITQEKLINIYKEITKLIAKECKYESDPYEYLEFVGTHLLASLSLNMIRNGLATKIQIIAFLM